MKKSTLILSVAVALFLGIFLGYFLSHKDTSGLAGTAAPAAATFNSAKIAVEQFNIGSSTIFSMFNGDASDRIISRAAFFAVGGTATSSNYVLQCATSSTQYQVPLGTNVNLVVNQALNTLGTTTGATGMYFGTTSPGITGVPAGTASTTTRIWPTQTYLICSSTDSVATTNSQNTLDANTTGFVGFEYFPQ